MLRCPPGPPESGLFCPVPKQTFKILTCVKPVSNDKQCLNRESEAGAKGIKKNWGTDQKKGRAPQRLLFLTPVKSVYFSIAITSWLMAMLFICGAGVDDGCFFGLLLLMLLRIFFCLMAVIRTIMIGFLALLIRVESGLKKNFLFETK